MDTQAELINQRFSRLRRTRASLFLRSLPISQVSQVDATCCVVPLTIFGAYTGELKLDPRFSLLDLGADSRPHQLAPQAREQARRAHMSLANRRRSCFLSNLGNGLPSLTTSGTFRVR